MTVPIKRGITIPTESSMEFHTVEENQTKMTIDELGLDLALNYNHDEFAREQREVSIWTFFAYAFFSAICLLLHYIMSNIFDDR